MLTPDENKRIKKYFDMYDAEEIDRGQVVTKLLDITQVALERINPGANITTKITII